MKLLVYAVYDKGVGAFMPPFYMRAPGEAMRIFAELVNDPKTNVSKYPADFTMYKLGEWDDDNGFFECGDPVRVVTGMEVLNASMQDEAARGPGARAGLDRRAM